MYVHATLAVVAVILGTVGAPVKLPLGCNLGVENGKLESDEVPSTSTFTGVTTTVYEVFGVKPVNV